MAYLASHWRVYVASIISVVFVVGAYVLAGNTHTPFAEASAETALLQAIATKDTDGDGLSDWEEALYGTSVHEVDSLDLGMSDGEAVSRGLIVPKAIADIKLPASSLAALPEDGSLPPAPGSDTLTAAFAQQFFTLYLATKEANGGSPLSDTQVAQITDEALGRLSSTVTVTPVFKSANDISISGTGDEALRTFAIQAEAIFLKHTTSATKSEVLYLQDAIEKNDTQALAQLAAIAKAYREAAVGMAALPVPKELAASDLALINALTHVSGIINDFAHVNDDPLTAMLGLQQYVPAAEALGEAFMDVGTVYKNANLVFLPGTPGASFVNLITDMLARQKAALKP